MSPHLACNSILYCHHLGVLPCQVAIPFPPGRKEVCTWKIMYVYISLQSLVHREIFFKRECNNIL